jgi:3-hydroxybutyryl-CoA dehydrogenase/5-formyl-3-hydroxy-2-methylpyridine 4-carboxylate dehydrogenase
MLTAAIVGLGTMGPGMAARMARGGIAVRAYDAQPAAIERAQTALPVVRGVLDRLKIVGPDAPLSFHATLEETVAGADP